MELHSSEEFSPEKRSKRKSNKAIAIINQAEKEKKIEKIIYKVPTNLIEKEEKNNQQKTVDHESEKKNIVIFKNFKHENIKTSFNFCHTSKKS